MIRSASEDPHDVDIKLVVSNYSKLKQFLKVLLQPLLQARDVILWKKNTIYSILSLIVLSTLCLVPELLVAVCLQALIFVMVCGYWMREDIRGDEHQANRQTSLKEDLAQFRYILFLVQQLLLTCCDVLDRVKSLVSWREPRESLLFTLACLAQGVVLVFGGIRWFLAMLPVCVFCLNSGFFNLIWPSKDSSTGKSHGEVPVQGTAAGMDDNVGSEDVSEDVHLSNQGHLSSSSRSQPNKIRRRFIGSCGKCGVAFANLLKRKHRCNNCGNYFCGKCSLKVKKTLLGATSPAAYSESVRVCVSCSEQLKELQNELTSSQHTDTDPASTT